MRIVVVEHLTLDGVMQSPDGLDSDTRDGFQRGGWAADDNDEVMDRWMGERMARGGEGGAMLFGRWTYEHLLRYWNTQPDSPYTPVLNNTPKYVASTTLNEPLPWPNSTLLQGDVPAAVAELRAREGGDLAVLGSGALLRSLMPHDLVDEYLLMIHPVVVGGGHRLFETSGTYAALELVKSESTTKGVLMASYRPKRGA